MNTQEMICIVCPLGCHLTVSRADEGYMVEGNQCDRGRIYAVNEQTNPLRTVTSTVKIKDLHLTRLPVKTERAFPKGKMLELIGALKNVTIWPPVHRGQVILSNALNTGINVVATKTLTEDG